MPKQDTTGRDEDARPDEDEGLHREVARLGAEPATLRPEQAARQARQRGVGTKAGTDAGELLEGGGAAAGGRR